MCLSVVKSAAGVRLVAVDLFCIPVGANPSHWIRMLMLYDRICISVTSILTYQRMIVGRFILLQIMIFLGGHCSDRLSASSSPGVRPGVHQPA